MSEKATLTVGRLRELLFKFQESAPVCFQTSNGFAEIGGYIFTMQGILEKQTDSDLAAIVVIIG